MIGTEVNNGEELDVAALNRSVASEIREVQHATLPDLKPLVPCVHIRFFNC